VKTPDISKRRPVYGWLPVPWMGDFWSKNARLEAVETIFFSDHQQCRQGHAQKVEVEEGGSISGETMEANATEVEGTMWRIA